MIIDTHVHLDTSKFKKDVNEVIERAISNGVVRFIIPAIDSINMDDLVSLSEQYNEVFFAAGHHPNRLDSYSFQKIKDLASHEKCVAIGECGLDYFRVTKGTGRDASIRLQKSVFRKQLEIAVDLKKPVILHSRDTDDDMIQIVSEYGNDLVGGVIHCYVGSDKLLELSKFNFYYGLGGISTYPSAHALHRNIPNIPFERIVLETDAPYLTPVPFRGKRNEPAYAREVLMAVSEILGKDYKLCEKQFFENSERLFFP